MIKIDQIDKALIQQMINFPNKKDKDLCISVGISKDEYTKRINSHDFKFALGEASKTYDQQLDDLKTTAIRKLKQLVNDDDKKIAIEAIKAVLTTNNSNIGKKGSSDKRTPYEKKMLKEIGVE